MRNAAKLAAPRPLQAPRLPSSEWREALQKWFAACCRPLCVSMCLTWRLVGVASETDGMQSLAQRRARRFAQDRFVAGRREHSEAG